MSRIIAITLLLLTTLLAGCASVSPWEKGDLARSEMAFDPDPLAAKLSGQVYHSKEGSSANTTTSGGGCGCN